MSLLCMSPDCGKPIGDGDRKVTLTKIIEWGKDDLRNDWQGDYVFHSFGCLSDWAAERAADHDRHTVTEGQA